MWGDPYDSYDEEWVAHLIRPPLHPLDGNVEQPTNMDEDLGMVQLVNDVFVVTNHVATRTTREANVGVVVETNILLEHVDQVLQDGGNLIERDRGHGVVRNLHGNQVVGPTSNIKTHLPSIHGDTSKNGGNNINFLPNRMDPISNSVGVRGVGIEPQPLGARHATDHILTIATKKYQNTTVFKMVEPHLDNRKVPLTKIICLMDELGRIPLFEGSTLIGLSFTLLILNCYKTHGSQMQL
jgi:hypothetical protein